MEINYCLFTLLRDNGTKAVQYCCVAKEKKQCCTSALLRNRTPTSRCYGNHNTQQYHPKFCAKHYNSLYIYIYIYIYIYMSSVEVFNYNKLYVCDSDLTRTMLLPAKQRVASLFVLYETYNGYCRVKSKAVPLPP
jgi:hypothetical protein